MADIDEISQVQNADNESESNIAKDDSDDDQRSSIEHYRSPRVFPQGIKRKDDNDSNYKKHRDTERLDCFDNGEETEAGAGEVNPGADDDSCEKDPERKKKKGDKKSVQFIFDQITNLKEKITDKSNLSSLKSEEVGQEIIALLKNTECNSSKEFKELLKKYLEPDHYEGIGIQFKESDPNYPEKTTFAIGHVLLGTFASEIGLEEGDVIVLDEENKMNIFELVVNLRNGKLNDIKEIVRSGQPIFNQEVFAEAGFDPQIGVTTVIDLKRASGEFNSIIKDKYTPEEKEGIDKIKEIVTKKKILPYLFDSLSNYSSNKTGKSAKSLEENIKKWAKTYSKNSNAKRYSTEASEERAFLEIDTVAYLTEFMMSISSKSIKFSDVVTGDEDNIFKSGRRDVSLKIIQSDDENKRVLIASDNVYYSVFCQIKKDGGQWDVQHWDAKGLCNPDSENCKLTEEFIKQLDQSARLRDGNTDFIKHDGTCGIGAAAICQEFLNGQDCELLKGKQHPDIIKDFIDKKRDHSKPTSKPKAIDAKCLVVGNEIQKRTE